MKLGRFSILIPGLVCALAIVLAAGGGPARAASRRRSRSHITHHRRHHHHRHHHYRHHHRYSRRRRHHRRHHRGHFHGHAVRASALRKSPVPKPSGNIWIYPVNFHKGVKVNIYNPDGSYDDAALAKLDHAFRCRRTGEVRAIDPRLYTILSVIDDHFGGRRIDLISGFRFQRNEGSRHFHGAAMDIRVPGVSTRELYRFAETLDTGGMGIGRYPRAGFVHVDFRAPGDPSYRWVDTSPPGTPGPGHRPSRSWHRKPSS